MHRVPQRSPLILAERGTGRLVRTSVLLPPRTASQVAKQVRQICDMCLFIYVLCLVLLGIDVI
jgi:hypothetical protein